MTRATEIRSAVLAHADEGLAEDEIAETLSIPIRRVRRLLDTVEAPEIHTKTDYDPPIRRTRKNGSSLPLVPPSNPRKRPPYVRRPGSRVWGDPQHGTESGYTSLHLRRDDPPCEPCRKAAMVAVQARRDAPGGLKDQRVWNAAAKRYHRWATDTFPREAEKRSINEVIRQTLLTDYTARR